MKLYKTEILDGLKQQLETQASVAIDCEIVKTYESSDITDEIKTTIAAICPSNPNQPDLYYINSILVSAGWNKNKDVFDKAELFSARKTPEDKPFNFMHQEDEILGHITGTIVLDEVGTEIDELPEKDFDIVVSSVIYKAWSDEEKSEKVQKLIREVEEGKWSVSMECMFGDFDYAVITPEGQEKVISRNEESSFLTKHLSVYGGKGEYEGYKLGRLLKNITFTGVGLVDRPANPRSIILNKDLSPFISAGGLKMAKAAEVEKVDEVVAELTQKVDSFTKLVAEKDQELASRDATIKELQDSLAQHKATCESKDQEVAKMKEDMEKHKKEAKVMKRRYALIEAGVSTDKLDEILTKFDAADDVMFTEVVALHKAPKVEAEEEVEEEIIPEKAEAALADTGDTKTFNEKAVASASEWLEKEVFTTLKGVK